MFSNSLFKDFLEDNELITWKDESTRDIICLEFNYGTRAYLQEINHLKKVANSAQKEYKRARIRGDKYLIDKARNKIDKINELLVFAKKNKKIIFLYPKKLRRKLYNDGISVKYVSKKELVK